MPSEMGSALRDDWSRSIFFGKDLPVLPTLSKFIDFVLRFLVSRHQWQTLAHAKIKLNAATSFILVVGDVVGVRRCSYEPTRTCPRDVLSLNTHYDNPIISLRVCTYSKRKTVFAQGRV
ncbi:unnamed protein product [Periconia digitata]|uniref:Uncharacterized protein n=1 Tax=Periconia digitata TaxID=1303443 RepID=A0A9W4UB93_9PLEO|nr:unnamed protein product [Periconia digitata]